MSEIEEESKANENSEYVFDDRENNEDNVERNGNAENDPGSKFKNKDNEYEVPNLSPFPQLQ